MAINLSKNRDSLLSAWKEVVDDKCKTNWALFGYEGQTNDLKVVSKGDGGIEELTDDLNSGKIMYAFCKIVDPKTSLPKCVLINWQGEGAPLVRKGTCANHVRDIARFFIGAHVTINARTEEEVDRDIIMDKVSKSTGSAYSFKDRADTTDVTQDSGPVLKCQSSGGGAPHLILCPPPKPKNLKGTTYKRVIPTQEINSKERDMFWEKEELEEKQRQAEERKRKDEERKKLEDERKQREVAEALKREEKIKERTRTIVQLREAEKNAENRPHQDVSKAREWEKDIEESERDERERKTRSDILRRQRSQEAQAVISKRTIDARAIFEQNTSAGQMQSRIMPGRLQSIPNSNGQRLPSLASSSSFDSTSNMPNDQPSNIPINQQRKASLPTWPPTTISTEEVSPKSVGKRHWPPLVEGEPSHSVADAKSAGQNLSEQNASAVKRETANADDGEEEQDWETPPLEAGPEIRDPVGALLREQGQGAPAIIPGESPYHQLASQDSSAGHSEAQPSITVQSQTHNNGQEVDVRPTTEGQEADGASQFSNGMLEETVTFTEGDYGRTARALYDYQAADATEISFDPGDIITNIDQIDEGWWQGVGPDGTFGLFPANYVELLN